MKPRPVESVCWGCDGNCPAEHLTCGNGSVRTPHPQELFGEDWAEWLEELAAQAKANEPGTPTEG